MDEHPETPKIEPLVKESASNLITTRRQLWAIMILLMIMFVVVLALQFQVSKRNHDINSVQASVASLQETADKTVAAAEAARVAAEEASQVLREAIEQSRDSSNSQALQEAYARLRNIEALVQQLAGAAP